MSKTYGGVSYDPQKDYMKKKNEAVDRGDYVLAAMYEQQRNAKIDGEKLDYEKTYDYADRLKTPGASSDGISSGSAGTTKRVGNSGARLVERGGAGGGSYSGYDRTKDLNALKKKKFLYDPNNDTTYKDMVKAVKDNASFVGSSVLADHATMTGGMPSSYAVSAAAAASADVLDDIPDIYAAREAQAYSRYMDDRDDAYQQISQRAAQDGVDYARYLDELERESAAASAAAQAEREERELLLKENESAADIQKALADIDYKNSQTAGLLIENEYSPYMSEAELRKALADIDYKNALAKNKNIENEWGAQKNAAQVQNYLAELEYKKAQTQGQLLANEYAPKLNEAELGYKSAQAYNALYGGAKSNETSNIDETGELELSELLDDAESGAMMTQEQERRISLAKDQGVYALSLGKLPNEEQLRAMMLYGYTSDYIRSALSDEVRNGYLELEDINESPRYSTESSREDMANNQLIKAYSDGLAQTYLDALIEKAANGEMSAEDAYKLYELMPAGGADGKRRKK